MVTDGVISIADARQQQLESFYQMERHREEFLRAKILYKSIYATPDELIGFIILVLEPDGQSVEFRRIVVSERDKGYGRRAVALVDEICGEELGRKRVWLDVFEFNQRGRHLYESNGYRYVGASEFEGKTLRLYEKAA